MSKMPKPIQYMRNQGFACPDSELLSGALKQLLSRLGKNISVETKLRAYGFAPGQIAVVQR